MGAYLTHPKTEKEIEVGENEKVEFAVAAMQGWRTEMEDAHVCALDVDKDMSVFGVFDGHGGKEVARFAALHIVEELQKTDGFLSGDISAALKEVYLSLDALIGCEESRAELAELSVKQRSDNENGMERVIHVDRLPGFLKVAIQEAEENLQNGRHERAESRLAIIDENAGNEEQEGPVISFPVALSDATTGGGSDKDDSRFEESSQEVASQDDGCSNNSKDEEECVPLETPKTEHDPLRETEKLKASVDPPSGIVASSNSAHTAESSSLDEAGDAAKEENTAVSPDPPAAKIEINSPSQKLAVISGAATNDETLQVDASQVAAKPRRRCWSIMNGLLSMVCPFSCLRSLVSLPEEDTISNENKDRCGRTQHPAQQSAPNQNRDAQQEISEEPVFQEINRDDWETDDNETEETVAGSTAVVAVLKDQRIYVANAGDSRCVLCRHGLAIPLSRDHKPTDPDEFTRIKKAGGTVSDGRVNGTLNLSRALGDMEYKESRDLSPEDYMVTANPEIQSVDVQQGDDFLILACDGIWDVLSNQKACTFVRSRLAAKQSLRSICAELCDYCLAEDTNGSGEGCDNMTVMVVLLKSNSKDS